MPGKAFAGAALAASLLGNPAQAAIIANTGGQYVWTDVVGQFQRNVPSDVERDPVVMLAVVPLADLGGFAPGDRLHISRIGMGGDSTANSGDNRFRLTSSLGTADFSWIAGQYTSPATYRLAPTTQSATDTYFLARGFTYQSVDITLAPGEGFSVIWDLARDYDVAFTSDVDALGNVFNDGAYLSSIRPWVQFDIVAGQAVDVPEPASALLLASGMLAIGTRRPPARR